MSFSFSSLIRLLVLLALGSTMAAVGLSKLDPPRPVLRARRITRDFNLNDYFVNVVDRTPRWLDSETGAVTEGPLDDGDVLETASSSPWVDEHGHRQVIGRWSSRTKDGPMSMSRDFGLARYTFPGGEPLDKVSTEIVPVSAPCWFPGTRARILFTAGDGHLYQYAFEADGRTSPGSTHDARPTPVSWRCERPGAGEVFLGDLTWPEDPRLGGCLIVSLRHQGTEDGHSRSFTRTQLWWLKLNHAGDQVVEAGRLITQDVDPASSEPFEERSPVVATLPDGRPILGYLRQPAGAIGWELRVAELSIDPDRRVPSVLQSSTKVLADRCQASHPAFSPDGRWLNVIVGQQRADSRVARFRTLGALRPLAASSPKS